MRWIYYIGMVGAFVGCFSGVAYAQGQVPSAVPANPVPPTGSPPGTNPAPPPTTTPTASNPPAPPAPNPSWTSATGIQTALPPPPPPPGADTTATGVAPIPPGGGPGTAIPQGSPNPQPYPYPYNPYYPPYPTNQQGAYPPPWGWAPRPAPVTTWYGWQTLIGVLAGDALTLIGGSFNNSPMIYIGVGAHVFTGPIVHWAHGNAGKGFISLGLNLGIPTIGALSSVVLGYYGLILAGIGYLAAPTLDMALLSTETVDGPATAPKGARVLLPSSVGIMPMLDPNRRGLMLVGRF